MRLTMAQVLGLFFALATVGFGAEDPHVLSDVDWFGKNGKSIRGVFTEEKDGAIHVLDLRSKKTYKLARENLSAETLAWFDRAKARDLKRKPTQPARRPAPSVSPLDKILADGFGPLDKTILDRSRLRAIDPSDYGLKGGEETPESFVPFFIWWDQNSNLPIPKGRTFKSKAQWIHKEIDRVIPKRNGSLSSAGDIMAGITEYFKDHFEDEVRVVWGSTIETSPAELAKATAGAGATVLRLGTYSKGRYIWTVDCSLVEAKEDGSISLILFNKMLTGKMQQLTQKAAEEIGIGGNGRRWEIELDAGSELPPHVQRLQPRFVARDLYVITPYLKPKKQEAAEAP